MERFLQLHLITAYPPSNLNRDDLGRPKSAIFGGTNRLRVSSQCLKRSWRVSDVFQRELEGHLGLRTKRIGIEVRDALMKKGVDDKRATELARKVAEQFGKLTKTKDDGEFLSETVTNITPDERAAIDQLVDELADGRDFEKKSDNVLREEHSAVDVAMFGRMLAKTPKYNVEAAVQVAHAITTHAATIEDDFFTAVDDLAATDEDRGSAHMGETEFGAGVYYLYACVDRAELSANLGDDAELAGRGIAALIEAMCTVAPSGKQNSFGSRAYASYVLAELGDRQPRSLSAAFLDPVGRGDQVAASIQQLQQARASMDKVYGECASATYELNAAEGTGSLKDLVSFAAGGLSDG